MLQRWLSSHIFLAIQPYLFLRPRHLDLLEDSYQHLAGSHLAPHPMAQHPHGYFSLFASCWLLLLNQSCSHQKNIIPTWIWVPGYSLLCVAIQPYCVGVWLGVAVQPFFVAIQPFCLWLSSYFFVAIQPFGLWHIQPFFVAIQPFLGGCPAIFCGYPAIVCGYPAIFLWLSSHLFEGIGCQSFSHFLKTFLK